MLAFRFRFSFVCVEGPSAGPSDIWCPARPQLLVTTRQFDHHEKSQGDARYVQIASIESQAYTDIHTCVCACMQTHTDTDTCMQAHLHVCLHTHTYKHTPTITKHTLTHFANDNWMSFAHYNTIAYYFACRLPTAWSPVWWPRVPQWDVPEAVPIPPPAGHAGKQTATDKRSGRRFGR